MIENPNETVLLQYRLECAAITDREKRRGRCPSTKELSEMRRLYAKRNRTKK